MIRQHSPQVDTAPLGMNPSVPVINSTKAHFAALNSTSTRTVDRWIEAKLIPHIKTPSAPGRDGKLHGKVLIPVADALAALNRFRVAAIGEPVTQRPVRRRMGRIADNPTR